MSEPKPAPASEPQSPDVAEERDDAVIGAAFRWSAAALALIVVLAAGGIWWSRRTPPVTPVKPAPLGKAEQRAKPTVEIPKLPFTDVTEAAGIRFVHENGASGDKLLPETMGGGVAFFDFDNDGDADLLFVNSQRWPWDKRADDGADAKLARSRTMALYRNDGRGSFEDVTAGSGLDVSFYGMGVACGDYDNDGRVDVFFSAVGTCRLFHNLGDGKFEETTEAAGVGGDPKAWSTSCGWFDADRDGDLDLLVLHYVVWSKEFDLSQPFTLKGGGRAYGRPQDFEGTYPTCYRNNGDGTFTDATAAAGFRIDNPLTKRPMAKSLGLTFVDVDNDGALDAVVANDTVQNMLFRNKGDGAFEEIGMLSGIAFDSGGNARGAMGIDACRFRADDSLGIAIGNFANEMTALYVSHGGIPQFNDEAVSNGLGPVTRLELTFGILFSDIDLDGRPDILAANGHLEEDINLVQQSQHYEQSPHLLWNCGSDHETEFLPVPAAKCGKDFVRPMVGRGLASADIDGDGNLDFVITASGGKPRLLRNDQDNGRHWLRVRLQGTVSNRDAIGAQVDVHLPDGIVQSRQVMPTRSYLSQCELPITFGLGTHEKPQRVIVRWPSGVKTEHADLAADQTHVLEEPRKE